MISSYIIKECNKLILEYCNKLTLKYCITPEILMKCVQFKIEYSSLDLSIYQCGKERINIFKGYIRFFSNLFHSLHRNCSYNAKFKNKVNGWYREDDELTLLYDNMNIQFSSIMNNIMNEIIDINS